MQTMQKNSMADATNLAAQAGFPTVPQEDQSGNVSNIQTNAQYGQPEENVTPFEGVDKSMQTNNMAKGGSVKSQTKKLLKKGGMLQEGGTVDPVSGNDVPVGAMQEEVRDDIPAKLSEGEFVFPADVVRYIGLERLMMMRQAAKEGLKKMEAMGQMSNSEEATIDDDVEFESRLDEILEEIDNEDEDETEMAEGGVAMPPMGQPQPAMQPEAAMQQPAAPQPQQAMQQQPKPQQGPTPTQIIREDMARRGFTPEKQEAVDNLTVNVAGRKAVAIRENNTVFIGMAEEPGVLNIHTFSVDDPEMYTDAVRKLIPNLKTANIKAIKSDEEDSTLFDELKNLGYNPVPQGEDTTAFTMDIQEEPAVQ